MPNRFIFSPSLTCIIINVENKSLHHHNLFNTLRVSKKNFKVNSTRNLNKNEKVTKSR